MFTQRKYYKSNKYHTEWGRIRTDCTAHLRRRQPDGGPAIQCAFQQLVTKDVVEVLGHDSLLLNTAVVLDGQDDWIFRYLDGGEEEVEGVSELVI